MRRIEMLKLLHEFDRRLSCDVEIHICGASSAILLNRLNRTTSDVDVLYSFPSIDAAEFRNIVLNMDDALLSQRAGWLNDEAKIVVGALPKSYKFDLCPIEGENFERLRPLVVSPADFIVCKMVLGGEGRPHDQSDLREIVLHNDDVERFYQKLDDIAAYNCSQALIMEGRFKELRPDFFGVRHKKILTNESHVADYLASRYGQILDDLEVKMLKRDIERAMPLGLERIVGRADRVAGKAVKSGNKEYEKNDQKYRYLLKKRWR